MTRHLALRITMIYVAVGLLWILASDRLLEFDANQTWFAQYGQTIKGGLYVLVTGLGLYLLLKASYRRLENSEAKYRGLVDAMPALVCRFGPDYTLEYVNDAYARAFGAAPDDLLGRSFMEYIPEQDRPTVTASIAALSPASPTSTQEHRVITPGGDIRWQRWTDTLLSDNGGCPSYQAFGVDITDLKAAEFERQVVFERNRDLVCALGEIVYEWWPQQDRLDWSGDFTRILGYTADAMGTGTASWFDRIHPDDMTRVRQETRDCVTQGRNYDLEYRFRNSDGSYRWMRDQGVPKLDGEGRLDRILGLFRDIDASKQAEAALRTAESQYRNFVENTSEGIYSFTPQAPIPVDLDEQEQIARLYLGRIDTCNDALAEMYGFRNAAALIGRSLAELHGGTGQPENIAFLTAWIQAGYRITEYESRERGSDGGEVWFANNVVGIVVDGRLVRAWGSQRDISERKRVQLNLVHERQRLQDIIEATRVGTWEWQVQSGETRFNARWAEIAGYRLDELEPVSIDTWNRLAHPADLEVTGSLLQRHFAGELDHYEHEARMRHKDGHWVWVLDRGRVVSRDVDGRPLWVAGTHTDITERKQAEERLRLLAAVFENTAEGAVITDADANAVEVNRAFTEILGYARDEVLGRNPRMWQSGRHDQAYFQNMWRALSETGHWRGEIWNRRKDGSVFPEWLSISSIHDAMGRLTHYIGVFSDISQVKQSEALLDHLAHHDALTDLPNRLLLNERLDQAIRHACRRRGTVALLFLDIDHFKHINDSFGHPVGDSLLQAVAGRLMEQVRMEDTVARIGGDEFVVLLEHLADPMQAGVVAQKVVAAFTAPFDVDAQSIVISVSLGICLYPQDGEDVDTLMRNADAAMYRAKDEGRNTHRFYTAELTSKAIERVTLEASLRRAIERDEFVLYYQPQVELASERVIGVEALIRWQHPELGMVSPARFIPLAEECGLISAIGDWVLRSACRQGRIWLERGLDFGRIAVNVAGPQVRPGLARGVQEILAETGLPAQYLELEVTEGFIMRQDGAAIEELHALRRLDVALAIDDFGTGYSSLGYLKRLPIQKIKIDQSFVRDLPGDLDDAAITKAVIALGGSLERAVIAEGVETVQQAEFLLHAGCREAQGYLYSRPIEPAAVERLFGRRP
jgi:diguanylate cyclase (GGDEF)-like protein/PAS domain S-box-containing protein